MITLVGEPESEDSDSEIVISCVRSISSDVNQLQCHLSERDSDDQEEVSEEPSQE
jgi:phage portal protein BeeE